MWPFNPEKMNQCGGEICVCGCSCPDCTALGELLCAPTCDPCSAGSIEVTHHCPEPSGTPYVCHSACGDPVYACKCLGGSGYDTKEEALARCTSGQSPRATPYTNRGQTVDCWSCATDPSPYCCGVYGEGDYGYITAFMDISPSALGTKMVQTSSYSGTTGFVGGSGTNSLIYSATFTAIASLTAGTCGVTYEHEGSFTGEFDGLVGGGYTCLPAYFAGKAVASADQRCSGAWDVTNTTGDTSDSNIAGDVFSIVYHFTDGSTATDSTDPGCDFCSSLRAWMVAHATWSSTDWTGAVPCNCPDGFTYSDGACVYTG